MAPRKAFLSLAVALITLVAPLIACGQSERIHDYHSQIEVLKDGSLKVTETIDVTAAGQRSVEASTAIFPRFTLQSIW